VEPLAPLEECLANQVVTFIVEILGSMAEISKEIIWFQPNLFSPEDTHRHITHPSYFSNDLMRLNALDRQGIGK